ncbi:flagellar hook-length control protein FliK [Virgibacillus sp. 179-BFC.A HS]|uniref:Flagellar hook-length control protein FliK n=1 Tax=Tigheibacillus jepli TaxID=3035914 RepID=A0ABU5CJ59_9BACI|nr:flagellar hook-length control protein FliK [Virgibacillus sp. 179-BFC.A HS]MDY0405882.1 flagellar hook-length control protein FliK [Virgibacillus sp. 179-BFC.A HS]
MDAVIQMIGHTDKMLKETGKNTVTKNSSFYPVLMANQEPVKNPTQTKADKLMEKDAFLHAALDKDSEAQGAEEPINELQQDKDNRQNGDLPVEPGALSAKELVTLAAQNWPEDMAASILPLLQQNARLTDDEVSALEAKINALMTNQDIARNIGHTTNGEKFIAQVGAIKRQQMDGSLQQVDWQKEAAALLAKAEEMFQVLEKGGDIHQAATKLLKLLEQWHALDLKSNGQVSQQMLQTPSSGQSNPFMAWQQLVKLFEKRSMMANKQQYTYQAKVFVEDVARWLEKVTQADQAGRHQPTELRHVTSTSMPMTKVEQFIIHLQQQSNVQQPEHEQLMERLEKIIRAGDFRQLQNGKTEWRISLRPQNLGDITIRMAQINGEMTVKIIAGTAAAKDMLESNLHQLKHMFSPHQVIVERQDLSIQTGQTTGQKEQQNNSNQDQQHASQEFAQLKESEAEDDDFSERIATLLMNEKA